MAACPVTFKDILKLEHEGKLKALSDVDYQGFAGCSDLARIYYNETPEYVLIHDYDDTMKEASYSVYIVDPDELSDCAWIINPTTGEITRIN
jgi:hypothetical protein